MTEQGGATAPRGSYQFQNQMSCLRSLLKFLLLVATGPYRRSFKLYTWKPIQEIRAANGDRKLLIPLVKDWKLGKYAEFKSVQITATFCGGAVLSSLPLARSENAIWIVNALWYCSLVCSIFAIVTSIQTVSMVDDLPSREQLNEFLPETDVQRMQQTILRYKKTPGIKHWVMMFIWQFPSMTMAYALLTYIAGLTVFLCSPFIKNLPWQGQHKVAIAYLSCALVGIIIYVSAIVFVYSGEKEYERSAANSCASTRASPQTSTLGDMDTDSNERAMRKTANQTRARAEPKGNTSSSTAVDEICPVEALRAKMLIGFESSEAAARDTERSGRSLLY